MQKTSDNQSISSASAHRSVQKSTTLNRRYVKRPAPVVKKIAISSEPKTPHIIESTTLEEAIIEAKDAVRAEDTAEIPVNTKISKFAPAPAPASAPALKIEVETADSPAEAPAADAPVQDIPVVETPAEPVAPEIPEEVDLPPAPNPYQAAIDARADALEVRKAASHSAEFYIGPTAEERKAAEIDKALADLAAASAAAEVKVAKKTKAKAKSPAKVAKPAKAIKVEKVAKAKKAAKPQKVEKAAAKPAKVSKKASVLESNVSGSSEMTKAMKKGRGKRLALALACSTACVVALGFVVYNNIPDISVRVTAMQSGIEASYPSYIPRDYSLSGVYINNDDAVVMDFSGPNDAKFSIVEEESSWDSTALLNNYVKKNWGAEEYTVARENGITIYIYRSNAVWVNGGILYKINASEGVLTKKQIKNIVTSI